MALLCFCNISTISYHHQGIIQKQKVRNPYLTWNNCQKSVSDLITTVRKPCFAENYRLRGGEEGKAPYKPQVVNHSPQVGRKLIMGEANGEWIGGGGGYTPVLLAGVPLREHR